MFGCAPQLCLRCCSGVHFGWREVFSRAGDDGFCALVYPGVSGRAALAAYFSIYGLVPVICNVFSFSPYDTSLKGGIWTTSSPTVSAILTDATAIVTEAIKWVQQFATAITSNPLILMFVLVAFVGLGVGLIRRLIRL